MVILEDTRNKDKKHLIKQKWFEENGIEVDRCTLYVGDYVVANKQNISIDTKKDVLEVANNLCSDRKEHERFRNECIKAQKANIKLIVLIEDDVVRNIEQVKQWKSKFSQVKGESLYKTMKTMEEKYGVKFEFCKKSESASIIYQLLLNA